MSHTNAVAGAQPNGASLAAEIAARLADAAKHAPPGALEHIAGEIAKLAQSDVLARAAKVGSRAPDFELPEAKGGRVRLSELRARGPVVVVFYRGGWCPFCDLQLRAYQRALPQFVALGATLLAISPQTPGYALSDAEKRELTFAVASDAGNRVARQFGLVLQLPDALRRVQLAFDAPLPRFNGDESWELPCPGVFVIDQASVIRFADVAVDWRTRVEPGAIVDALRAL